MRKWNFVRAKAPRDSSRDILTLDLGALEICPLAYFSSTAACKDEAKGVHVESTLLRRLSG